MKVLLSAPFPPAVGGIATWAKGIVDYKKDDLISYVVLDQAEKKQGNKNFITNIARSFRVWKDIIVSLKTNSIDLVHINIPANSLSMLREIISIFIIHLFNKPVLIHFHCTLSTIITSTLQDVLFKILCSKADGVITLNSQSLAYVGKKNRKTTCIPNYALAEMLEDGRKRITKVSMKTVLYVGNVIEDKGCGEIIEVARNFPSVEFRLVGRIGKGFMHHDVPSNVIFAGVKLDDELKKEFLNADLFVFLSFMPAEGFSVALTEAMAYGLPCIVTDWAANKDMIGDKGGIVVNIHDIKAISNAIHELSDSKKREAMSRYNVDKVEKEYTLPAVYKKIYSFYKYVLNEA